MTRFWRAYVIIPFILLANACAYLPTQNDLKAPSVTLANIHFEKGSLFEQHFVTQVRLHNPNNQDIPIKSLQLALDINKRPLGEGSYYRPFTLPAHSDATVTFDIRTNLLGSLATLQKIIKSKDPSVKYRLHGHIEIDHWFTPNITIDKTNALNLPHMSHL